MGFWPSALWREAPCCQYQGRKFSLATKDVLHALNDSVSLAAQDIPGLGDLPILGPFFSNTSSKRTEKELIVLVTPYLVDSLKCDEVPPVPGADVHGPNDLEFFLGNRIEGRTGRDWRATTQRYSSAPELMPAYLRLHQEYIRGPHGFSD